LMVEYVGQKRPCKSSVARFVGSQSRIHAKQMEQSKLICIKQTTNS
jgi:hypothetical protein